MLFSHGAQFSKDFKRMDIIKKSTNINAGEGVEKRVPSNTTDGAADPDDQYCPGNKHFSSA